mgnify:CR=1 FL=1
MMKYDAIIVGAGFAGMYMLHRLREAGFTAQVLEAGEGVGGTWYWNRYPGARCDVQSIDYSFSFSAELEQQWQWSEKYATQAEILRYANHVADRFDLRRDIRFNTRVQRATFDQASSRWQVESAQGEQYSAQFYIVASGCLSVPKAIDIAGTTRLNPPEIGAFELLSAVLSINPTSIDFGGQGVGSTSAASTVTLSNTGNAPLTVNPLTAAVAPFARAGGTCTVGTRSRPTRTTTRGSRTTTRRRVARTC